MMTSEGNKLRIVNRMTSGEMDKKMLMDKASTGMYQLRLTVEVPVGIDPRDMISAIGSEIVVEGLKCRVWGTDRLEPDILTPGVSKINEMGLRWLVEEGRPDFVTCDWIKYYLGTREQDNLNDASKSWRDAFQVEYELGGIQKNGWLTGDDVNMWWRGLVYDMLYYIEDIGAEAWLEELKTAWEADGDKF